MSSIFSAHFTYPCQAQIKDELGNKCSCTKEATKEIIIDTFAPHLKARTRKTRKLCNKHASRLLARHRYQIKHLNKDCILTISKL